MTKAEEDDRIFLDWAQHVLEAAKRGEAPRFEGMEAGPIVPDSWPKIDSQRLDMLSVQRPQVHQALIRACDLTLQGGVDWKSFDFTDTRDSVSVREIVEPGQNQLPPAPTPTRIQLLARHVLERAEPDAVEAVWRLGGSSALRKLVQEHFASYVERSWEAFTHRFPQVTRFPPTNNSR